MTTSSSSGPLIQNFSVAAGNAVPITFDVGPDGVNTLTDCTIVWKVYNQAFGEPNGDPIISKTSPSDGIEIVDPIYQVFEVDLVKADTLELLGNYYHEATVIDALGNESTPTVGIMTVTQALNG
jgi:hypothetical protein